MMESAADIWGFATQGSNGDDENRLKALLSRRSVRYLSFSRRRKLADGWSIFRSIVREKPSLVVMEGTGLAGGLALIAGNLVAKVPYVVSSGDAVGPFVSSRKPLAGPLFGLYEKVLCRRSIGFIGWTPYLAGRALTFGARHGMTAAGWAPFAYTEEERAEARRRIREAYGIPSSHIVIGLAGSLNWNKRAGYCYGYELVSAAKRLKRRDVTVLIVGDGSGREKLEEAGRGMDSIRFTGRVLREEVPAFLSAMDLASLPQSVDQVGSFRYTTKVSEYLSVGLPIVTGKIPMAYDLSEAWMYRLPGSKPWGEAYISGLADLLERITPEEISDKSLRVPRTLPVFDKERQIESVGAFIEDILAEARSGSI